MKTKILTTAPALICLSLIFSNASSAQTSHEKRSKSVLLITSAQMDLLSEEGKAWGFTKDSEAKNQVRKNLKKVLREARKRNMPIIHSPVGFDYGAMKGIAPLNPIQGVIIENQLLDMHAPGAGFIPEAQPLGNEIVLPFRQGFTSFWANSIQEHLEQLEVETIFIAGMLAEGCVASHVRDASENGYATKVISDAIGSTSLELLEASGKTLVLHAGEMISSQEFLKN